MMTASRASGRCTTAFARGRSRDGQGGLRAGCARDLPRPSHRAGPQAVVRDALIAQLGEYSIRTDRSARCATGRAAPTPTRRPCRPPVSAWRGQPSGDRVHRQRRRARGARAASGRAVLIEVARLSKLPCPLRRLVEAGRGRHRKRGCDRRRRPGRRTDPGRGPSCCDYKKERNR